MVEQGIVEEQRKDTFLYFSFTVLLFHIRLQYSGI